MYAESEVKVRLPQCLSNEVLFSGRSEVLNVFPHSDIGVMVSNPTRGLDVRVCFFSSPLVCEVTAYFADRGVSRSQRGGSATAVISVFWTADATFSFK
jgi:hypothetical protein